MKGDADQKFNWKLIATRTKLLKKTKRGEEFGALPLGTFMCIYLFIFNFSKDRTLSVKFSLICEASIAFGISLRLLQILGYTLLDCNQFKFSTNHNCPTTLYYISPLFFCSFLIKY